VAIESFIDMHADDFESVNGLRVSAGQNGSTALHWLAGSDESRATFPLGIAPKILRHKILARDIMRKIRGINRLDGELDGRSPACFGEGYAETFPYN
jgi:hypothetical protein